MGRVRLAVTVAAAVGLTGTSIWALAERADLRERVGTLGNTLDSTNDRIESAAAVRHALARTAAVASRRAKQAGRRVNSLKGSLYGVRLDLKRSRDVLDALVPSRRSVFETRLLDGPVFDLLAVNWHRSGAATLSGIDVWRIPASGRKGTWERVYIAEPRPSFELGEASYILHGDPASPTREEVDFIQMIEILDVGDATGDGLEDLAIREQGSGSGG